MTEEIKPQEKPIEAIDGPIENKPKLDVEPPQKRGRGRPPKIGGEGEDKPKRARKSSTKSSSKTDLATKIEGIHQFIAALTSTPEMILQRPEAELLAEGCQGILDEYGVEMSGKMGAALNMIAAAAIVYIPRAVAVRRRYDTQSSDNNLMQKVETAPSKRKNGEMTDEEKADFAAQMHLAQNRAIMQ